MFSKWFSNIFSCIKLSNINLSHRLKSKNIEMIEDFSNSMIVFQNAKRLFGNNVIIQLSTKKTKKYMLFNPYTNKWIHFGQMGFEDFTKHNDIKRRNKFRIRNKRWENENPYSPAFLSYHLLW